MSYYCNPLNINYRYQFVPDADNPEQLSIYREAADPSMIQFKGKYYMMASMMLGVLVSEDMVHWTYHKLPKELPLYDYAPDIRAIGDYAYLCASKGEENCSHYRTRDIVNGPYEELKGNFPFWDPNMFIDDDGRVYFYWGCSDITPIWGIELDPVTLLPKGEKVALIKGDPYHHGYERTGEDYATTLGTATEKATDHPYIEGAWMDKHEGRYYLQYACPGTQFNTYADGVYLSDSPLGPFTLAKNNPFSYKPGGFLKGAGHGSTMYDRNGNLWHTATMRISVNHMFERRLGLWPAGYDTDGELFCNQQYGDWPREVIDGKMDAWSDPAWYLLSYKKYVTSSSYSGTNRPECVADEDARTWWKAGTNQANEWLLMDLGKAYDVHGVQINFADDRVTLPVPEATILKAQGRYIEEREQVTRWILEGSVDGITYRILQDNSNVHTDLPHEFVVIEEGISLRYLRLTIQEVPYQLPACISGFRVFGMGDGNTPSVPVFKARRITPQDMEITIKKEDAVGYNVVWGHEKDKLYHSRMSFDRTVRVGALVNGQEYYIRVDAFNENGITKGALLFLQ